MKNIESISVIIPTYNRANDLLIAIKSALEQTYPILEILVCDDGSIDNSKELVSQLQNPIIKWIDCGKNGGPAIPRNIGIKHSKGDWIAFLDSDDSWMSQKIEKQFKAMETNKVMASCTNASRIRFGENKGSFLRYDKSLIQFTDLLENNCIICSSVIVKKELLLSVSLFPDEKIFIAIEDFVLWIRLSTKTAFAFVNENLVHYHDNVETSLRANDINDGWNVLEKVFADFISWNEGNKSRLDLNSQKALSIRMKEIKKRGVLSPFEDFMRRLKDKLGLNKRNL